MQRTIIYLLSLTIFFPSISFAQSKTRNNICSLHNFDKDQKKVLLDSYSYGKPFGLGYSLSAIAWKESSAGRNLENSSDPSYGVHHILLSSAMKRSGSEFKRKKLAKMLKENHKLSAIFALKELVFWKKALNKKDRNWRNVWAAYNGGYRYKKRAPQQYAYDIAKKISWLKQCGSTLRN